MDGTSKNQLAYEDFSGFGSVTAIGGSSGSAFKFGGGNGCQTEADTGLVLMGHRYYDSRQGRFISQDPAGDGDNWYAYAGNSPTNEVDPDGLMPMDGPGSSAMGSPGYADGAASGSAGAFSDFETSYSVTHTWIQDHERIDGVPTWVDRPGSDTWSFAQSIPDSSVTTPAGAGDVGSMGDGMTVGKQGNPLKPVVDAVKAYHKTLSQAQNKIQMFKGDAIKDVRRLVNQYGGKLENWEKMKGWMPHDDGESNIEIHWYQNMKDGLGRFEAKSKLW